MSRSSAFSLLLHPKANIASKPSGRTYFHTMLNEETWILILINLRKTKAIFKCHIACFDNIVPESLVAHPCSLPSLVLLSIELLANTARDVIMGLEDSSLLHVLDEGL
ncbi:uncharacterized protein N7469_002096 [Penicillium citrinum]|uniref:Uncharacterized protein n=1 Tax=Penicillium citrinum TaxID=5077 RepID=A0A9W9TT68_PENCI|nr:uncharacterized protein N7469_002096 [Penicillium citrinum]KAJ5240505.1 hypothetical protein N7469_002096 [Penicillium citrinum]